MIAAFAASGASCGAKVCPKTGPHEGMPPYSCHCHVIHACVVCTDSPTDLNSAVTHLIATCFCSGGSVRDVRRPSESRRVSRHEHLGTYRCARKKAREKKRANNSGAGTAKFPLKPPPPRAQTDSFCSMLETSATTSTPPPASSNSPQPSSLITWPTKKYQQLTLREKRKLHLRTTASSWRGGFCAV